MKGKSKTQKGITLIALIITIVVLLILAAVAVSSIQNDGILQYAQNAADSWNQAQVNEVATIQNYLDYLEDNFGGTTGGDTTVQTVPTAPTEIVATSVSGSTVTLQATGGTDESGTVEGYQYSMYGTNWSETIASGTDYTTEELIESGKNYTDEELIETGTKWTIYAKTINESGNSSTAIKYSIITLSIMGQTYLATEGMTWREFINSEYNINGWKIESETFGYEAVFYSWTNSLRKAIKYSNFNNDGIADSYSGNLVKPEDIITLPRNYGAGRKCQ